MGTTVSKNDFDKSNLRISKDPDHEKLLDIKTEITKETFFYVYKLFKENDENIAELFKDVRLDFFIDAGFDHKKALELLKKKELEFIKKMEEISKAIEKKDPPPPKLHISHRGPNLNQS